ncbi:tRNA (adenosine(37)-N6)-dimethylallyltransferase MiaA [Bacillus sp. 2205SS5-2]|uniref:tRNA (adenosine(37)-N6)-dimethylallyltransferase MiaA n=1 Tax=Bacillus sp. 2205SS5-2 TaxID=3109031 RepID=UPI003007DB97
MNRLKKENVIVLIGPTAVGKTELSLQLAKKFRGEIISGDSMQIYRRMDIGTAKISPQEMQVVPHHLIDIKNPEEDFSAAEFQQRVRGKMNEVKARGFLPMIVGGTGLYIQSVLYDYQFTEAEGDEEYRLQLEKRIAAEGVEQLFHELEWIDPISAEKIHPNNTRRVIRALEIFHLTGKTMAEYQAEQQHELLYDATIIGLTMDRDQLYERINRRVDIMMQQGLLQEVKKLYDEGIRNVQSIQAIGYKELYDYFDGKCSLEEAVSLLKQNSRRYAKRQLTWFRNKMDVHWFDVTSLSELEKIERISQFVAGKLH